MEYLVTLIPGAAPYVAAAIAICAALATIMPAPTKPGGWYRLVYGLVNHLALNVGKATNAGAPWVKKGGA